MFAKSLMLLITLLVAEISAGAIMPPRAPNRH